ncbi:unnamed protein product, partial [Polarella glacialis]
MGNGIAKSLDACECPSIFQEAVEDVEDVEVEEGRWCCNLFGSSQTRDVEAMPLSFYGAGPSQPPPVPAKLASLFQGTLDAATSCSSDRRPSHGARETSIVLAAEEPGLVNSSPTSGALTADQTVLDQNVVATAEEEVPLAVRQLAESAQLASRYASEDAHLVAGMPLAAFWRRLVAAEAV